MFLVRIIVYGLVVTLKVFQGIKYFCGQKFLTEQQPHLLAIFILVLWIFVFHFIQQLFIQLMGVISLVLFVFLMILWYGRILLKVIQLVITGRLFIII